MVRNIPKRTLKKRNIRLRKRNYQYEDDTDSFNEDITIFLGYGKKV